MWHSITDLKIYRTSNGNRYDENLTPTMTDKTVDVPGGDGQYYFGTTFKNRTFTVNYAFDNLRKDDIATMKRIFCGDSIHELVFDEDRDTDGTALKTWSAKVTGTATMKHLCFEENGEDIYKGEGSITFTCYFPFARSVNKGLFSTNNGDRPAPLVATFKRRKYGNLGAADEIKGISYRDGSEGMRNFDILFATPQAVGDGEYSWNSATGIVTYNGEIIPVSGQTILNIPVGYSIGGMYFIKNDGTECPLAEHTDGCSFYEYYL